LPPAVQSALIQGLAAANPAATATPPEHQVALQSFVDVNKRLSFDNSVYFVGRLSIGVPAYTRVDSRLSYRFNPHFEARLVGQNLLQPQHVEFANVSQVAVTAVPRSVFAELRCTF
jgi:outer membrane receptor for ferric coprogen and ferric-rhodotorulic acid